MLLSVPPFNSRAPQEALQHFLSSWHEALAHMSRTHQDVPAATEQLKALRQTFTAHLVPTLLLPEAPPGPLARRELPAAAAAAAPAAPALVCPLSLLLCLARLVPLLRPRFLMPAVTEQEELDAASRAVDDAAANPVRSRARRVRTGRAQHFHCVPAAGSTFLRADVCVCAASESS